MYYFNLKASCLVCQIGLQTVKIHFFLVLGLRLCQKMEVKPVRMLCKNKLGCIFTKKLPL